MNMNYRTPGRGPLKVEFRGDRMRLVSGRISLKKIAEAMEAAKKALSEAPAGGKAKRKPPQETSVTLRLAEPGSETLVVSLPKKGTADPSAVSLKKLGVVRKEDPLAAVLREKQKAVRKNSKASSSRRPKSGVKLLARKKAQKRRARLLAARVSSTSLK
ncbi:MAG: hypothetical protein L6R30_10010 [Thermoanaerobaculia bacterium]|nr:hypothetical protein [Thermoanaerobaculia bacterium]